MPDDVTQVENDHHLLDCPFCGGKAELYDHPTDSHRNVQCEDCLSEGPWCKHLEDAIAGWNLRTPAEARGAARAREWLPIESAPDSCVLRLLYEPLGIHDQDDPLIYIGGYTVRCAWETESGEIMNPTHWQPLPAPPAALSKDQADAE